MSRFLWSVLNGLIVGMLVACGSAPVSLAPSQLPVATVMPPQPAAERVESAPVLPASIVQARSRWTAVPWSDLPGWGQDPLHEAWNAWLKSCERPGPVFAPLCGEVRRLSLGSAEQQRDWMMSRLQPYRVDALQGGSEGLLTAYFEPMLDASRRASAAFSVPLYRPPAGLAQRKRW